MTRSCAKVCEFMNIRTHANLFVVYALFSVLKKIMIIHITLHFWSPLERSSNFYDYKIRFRVWHMCLGSRKHRWRVQKYVLRHQSSFPGFRRYWPQHQWINRGEQMPVTILLRVVFTVWDVHVLVVNIETGFSGSHPNIISMELCYFWHCVSRTILFENFVALNNYDDTSTLKYTVRVYILSMSCSP